MPALALTYREFAKVCRAFRTLGGERQEAERLRYAMADRLVARSPELGRRIAELSAAQFQALLLHLRKHHGQMSVVDGPCAPADTPDAQGFSGLAHPLAQDRREGSRFQPVYGTTARLHAAPGDGTLCLVWNLSRAGLSLLLRASPPPSAAFPLDLRTADASSGVAATLLVAHCTRLRTGDLILGGRFSRPLTPDELRPFLG
jgi:hypothetical protein